MSDRPFAIGHNKNVPQVQEPVADLGSLLTTVRSLKQGVESLGGYRGALSGRAVTFEDLAALGLVTPAVANSVTGAVTSGVATKDDLAQLVVSVSLHAALPAAPTLGQQAVVTDAAANTWGATAVGGGSFTVLVWWNGTIWTVLGV